MTASSGVSVSLSPSVKMCCLVLVSEVKNIRIKDYFCSVILIKTSKISITEGGELDLILHVVGFGLLHLTESLNKSCPPS